MPDLSASAIAILAAVRAIPRGQVASYGQVAARAGLPGRARLVAWALRQDDGESALPWFRVVRADRRIAFAPGSEDYRRQSHHLQAEGVHITGGRVAAACCVKSKTDLDRAVWG